MTANGHKKGFRIPLSTATLQFVGEYEGLEVVCRLNVPLETYMGFVGLAELADQQDIEQVKGLGEYFERFSEQVLLSWNLEDEDGEPVPARPAGLTKAPLDLSMLVLSEWMKAVKAGPLVETSSGSSTSSASAGGRSRARSSGSRRTS